MPIALSVSSFFPSRCSFRLISEKQGKIQVRISYGGYLIRNHGRACSNVLNSPCGPIDVSWRGTVVGVLQRTRNSIHGIHVCTFLEKNEFLDYRLRAFRSFCIDFKRMGFSSLTSAVYYSASGGVSSTSAALVASIHSLFQKDSLRTYFVQR